MKKSMIELYGKLSYNCNKEHRSKEEKLTMDIKEKYREVAEKIKDFAQTKKGKIILSTSACALVALIITGVVASGIPQSSDKVAGSQKEAVVSRNSAVSSGSEVSSAASGTSSATVNSASSAGASSSSTGTSTAPSAAQTAAVAVASVDFNHRSLSLAVGATAQITANITPANATDKSLSWTSSDSGIATVDGNGSIKAVGAGTAYIRATNSDGQRDTCTVTVSSGSTGGSGKSGGSTNNNGGGGNSGNTGGSTNTGGGSTGGGTTSTPYYGTDQTRTFTDQITGIQQTVQFTGVGANHNMVAAVNGALYTSSSIANSHFGYATFSISGSNGYSQSSSSGGIFKTGATSNFLYGNLHAGNYTISVTAHDGTPVARISFTVNSDGTLG